MENEHKLQDEEEEVSEKHVPIKGKVKWEKRTTRTSSRVHKKPESLGNKVIVKTIEQESSIGESLPSVYEFPPPLEHYNSPRTISNFYF